MLHSKAKPSPDLAHSQEELHEGIENSRELVRKTSFLIALSESDGATPPDDDRALPK